jgi:hypothetical protein
MQCYPLSNGQFGLFKTQLTVSARGYSTLGQIEGGHSVPARFGPFRHDSVRFGLSRYPILFKIRVHCLLRPADNCTGVHPRLSMEVRPPWFELGGIPRFEQVV